MATSQDRKTVFPHVFRPHEAQGFERDAVFLLTKIHETPIEERRDMVKRGVKRTRMHRTKVRPSHKPPKDRDNFSMTDDDGKLGMLKYHNTLFTRQRGLPHSTLVVKKEHFNQNIESEGTLHMPGTVERALQELRNIAVPVKTVLKQVNDRIKDMVFEVR